MKSKIATITLWIVTIIWGFGFIMADIALKELSTLQFMTLRFLIASIVIGIIINKKILTITKKELKYGFLIGVVLFLCFYFQTLGLNYTTPSKNAFLTAVYVVFVPIFAFFLGKKKMPMKKCICAILAIIGSGIMSLNGNLDFNLGDSLSLICSVLFALQLYLTDIYVKKIRLEILVFLEMFFTFLISFIFTIPNGIAIPSNRYVITSVLGSGVLATSLCYFLQSYAQKYINETTAALILSLEAVFGMLASYLILNEHITIRMLIGAFIILLSVFASEFNFKSKTKKDNLL